MIRKTNEFEKQILDMNLEDFILIARSYCLNRMDDLTKSNNPSLREKAVAYSLVELQTKCNMTETYLRLEEPKLEENKKQIEEDFEYTKDFLNKVKELLLILPKSKECL